MTPPFQPAAPLTIRYHENSYRGKPGGVQASVRTYENAWAQQTFPTLPEAQQWASEFAASLSHPINTNPAIERLLRTERAAREISNRRDANELRWNRQIEAARKTPEWKTYCSTHGIVENYDYGDLLA